MEHDSDMQPQWLREQPPVWPWHESGPPAEPRRLSRPIEIYEESSSLDLYPGATAMEDLAETEDQAGCVRVLARYATLRVLMLSASGWLTGPRLRIERRVALEHLALLPAHDWERQSLERLAQLSRETAPLSIVPAIAVCAEAAAKRGHLMGAFALYRSGFELARRRAWWPEAAMLARGIARLARLDEAHYSERLWERRARVLERRVTRLRETQEERGDWRRV